MTAALGTLAFAVLLAQTTPLPTTSTSASGAPQATDDLSVRRGPATTPRMLGPGASNDPGDVTIRNSGSTNVPGYVVVVEPDGSASVTVAGTNVRRMVRAPQLRWLFLKLRAAGPLDALPPDRCMKSASFGSTTTIAYRGLVSPDLSCGDVPIERELARTAGVIVDQLGVGTIGGLRTRGRLPG